MLVPPFTPKMSSQLELIKFHRDLLVSTLDSWIAIEKQRFEGDSLALRDLAVEANLFHAKTFEAMLQVFLKDERKDQISCDCGDCDDAESVSSEESERLGERGFEERNKWRAMRDLEELHEAAREAANREIAALEKLQEAYKAAAPENNIASAPNALPCKEEEKHPYSDNLKRLGYSDKYIQNVILPVYKAYQVSKEAGRQAELEHGTWATVRKRRVMIYKGHAFEPPTDRNYAVPGPVKHLGKYNRAAKRIEPSDQAPEVPQTADDYPWLLPPTLNV